MNTDISSFLAAHLSAHVRAAAAFAAFAACAASAVTVQEALDNADFAFSTSGDARWFGQAGVASASGGSSSAQSGAIGDGGVSRVSAVFSATNAVALSFAWKTSSEAGADHLRFFVDGVERDRISGDSDWKVEEFALAAGTHEAVWEYSKDESLSKLDDAAWVDKVALRDADASEVRSDFQIWMVDTFGLADDATYLAKGAEDADGDGFSNLQEYIAGTDPKDAADRLRIVSIDKTSGTAKIAWSPDGKPGRTYTMKTSQVLGTGENWGDAASGVSSPWTDQNAGTASKFYKVKVEMSVPDYE